MKSEFKIADLVSPDEHRWFNSDADVSTGVIISTNLKGWGEDLCPPCIEVLWDTGEFEIVYEDEINLIRTSHGRARE